MNPDTAPVTLIADTIKRMEERGYPRTPGAIVEYCDGCKAPVSVGPKAQSELAARPGSRILCPDCGVRAAKVAKDVRARRL